MEINSILLGVLLVVACVACAVAIWALLEGAKTARSARTLADDLDTRLVPLLDKADVTIDALNAELLRIDNIVSRIEEVTERVESTSRTVQGVANAPGEIVTDIADRVRRAWKRRGAEATVAGEARRAEAASEGADVDEGEVPFEAQEPPAWPTAEERAEAATESGPQAEDTTSV
ncbi:MAG: hypothetical protein P4L93_08605 [Coriobacteriia bacterium]|nr:hypothetical protein [Coriobacteriia bacterium]